MSSADFKQIISHTNREQTDMILGRIEKMVKQHFAEYDSRKLQKLCSTKDIFCRRIAEHHGDNDFVLPHHRDYGLSSEVSDEFEWYQCQ